MLFEKNKNFYRQQQVAGHFVESCGSEIERKNFKTVNYIIQTRVIHFISQDIFHE